jgi:ADP-ribosylation factor related protein 1
MYTLLSGLYDLAAAREEVRLLIIGLDGAGKTSLMHALVAAGAGAGAGAGAATPATRPTVGLNVGRLDVCGASVMLWDLGGAAGLRVIWER